MHLHKLIYYYRIGQYYNYREGLETSGTTDTVSIYHVPYR